MNDKRITAYLLQELTEEEAGRFEEQCFALEEWPADLDAAEQELIDAYLNNELSKNRRLRFEKNYLTTDARKARVLTAHSLHKILPPPPPSQKATLSEKLKALWPRPVVLQSAVMIVLLAVCISLLVPFFIRGRRPLQTFQRLDLAMSSSDRGTGVQTAKVILPLRADALEIHLKLPEQSTDAAAYRVQWENVNESLGDLQIASKDTQSAVVVIPAFRVGPGQYALKLFRIKQDGTEQRVDGNYYFTAEDPDRTR